MATITKLASVRASMALAMARELARAVTLDDAGQLHGHPAVLEALCRYLGADARGARRGSVWVAPRHRPRLRVLGIRTATAPVGLQGAA